MSPPPKKPTVGEEKKSSKERRLVPKFPNGWYMRLGTHLYIQNEVIPPLREIGEREEISDTEETKGPEFM